MNRTSLVLVAAILAGIVLWLARNLGPFQSVTYAPLRPSPGETAAGRAEGSAEAGQRLKVPAIAGTTQTRHEGKSLEELQAAQRVATGRFNRERNRLVEQHLREGKFLSDLHPSPSYPKGPPLAEDPSKPLIVVGRPNYDTPGEIEYRQVFLDRARHETLDELASEVEWLEQRIRELEGRAE